MQGFSLPQDRSASRSFHKTDKRFFFSRYKIYQAIIIILPSRLSYRFLFNLNDLISTAHFNFVRNLVSMTLT